MDQRDFGMSFDMFGSIIHSVRAYALLGNADLLPHTRHARWFLRSLSLLGASSLLFGLYSLFRPIAYRYRELPHERSRAAKFVVEHSASTDDYFKLWPHDKTYYFAADASAMLAYGVAADTAIVIGDPVGTAAGIDRIVPEFDSVCVTHGWAPSYMYVAQTNRSAYEAAGYELVKVGEDAVVNLTEFANHTARNKHFRNIRNRFEKAGYTTQFIAPPHAESLIADLTLVSDDWLRSPNRKEWKFLTGFFSRQYIASTPVFVVRDANGAIQAFANLIPVYTPSASTIDLMRHFRQAPNNAMDYLLYSLMLHLQQQGIKTFNMGLAPLAGLGGDEARPEERLLNLLYRTRQSYVSFQGLRQFKGKFEPIWEPKYMAYRSNIGTLPRIAYALNKLMRN
jgi:phosphatidylglycerol lysyltransferase